MSSGDTNVRFRCIIWTKEIFFRQSDTCPFLTKSELVYKNPLKRGQSSNHNFRIQKICTRKNYFFTRFTQKQPIHDGIKNTLNTLLHGLLGGSSEVPTKYHVKIKMM